MTTTPLHRAVLPWLLAAAALLPAARLAAQNDGRDVSLRLEPGDVVGLDEPALLSLRIEGMAGRGAPRPDFELENFEIAAGPSQSTSLTILNGVPSSSLTLSWHLRPLAVGAARVHSVRVRIGDETFELPERRVEVVAEAPPRRRQRPPDPFESFFGGRSADPFDRFDSVFERRRPRRAPREPRIFLEAEAVPSDPWVGQQVLYTLYLYTEADVRSINPEDLPGFHGFWSRVIPQPERVEPELVRRDGERIYRFVLLERALFPRRAGELEIPGVSATMDALVRDGSFFPRARQIGRRSEPVTVRVRELPPAPEGFTGAVGQLRLTAELEPRDLTVGDASTLTLTLSGYGHLGGVPAPELPALDGVEVFPPQQQSEEDLRRGRVHGKRTWSYVLVPQRPGRWPLDALEVPIFDPAEGRYVTASVDGLELVARGATLAVQDDGARVELHPIRTAVLPAEAPGGRALARWAPWLFALPWGLALAVLAVRRRGLLPRAGGARSALLARLRAAETAEQPRRAAAEIEDAWRAFLEARWEIPPGTPSPRWAAFLGERGADPAAAGELVELADEIHYLRYAPKLSSTDELQRDLVRRSRRLARALR